MKTSSEGVVFVCQVPDGEQVVSVAVYKDLLIIATDVGRVYKFVDDTKLKKEK